MRQKQYNSLILSDYLQLFSFDFMTFKLSTYLHDETN